MSRKVDNTPRSTMSFGDHLEELRRRVFLSVIVPVPLMLVLFIFAGRVREVLCAPLLYAMRENNLPAKLTVLSPIETMMADLKIALIGALVIAAPWVLYQLWKFVAPGLHSYEARFVRLLLPGSALLAAAGILLLYFVLLPLMLSVLVGFSVAPTMLLDSATDSGPEMNGAIVQVLPTDPATAKAGEFWINSAERELRVAIPAEGDPARVEVARIPLEHPGTLVASFRLSEYLDFVLLFAMCLALAFQLPIVLLLLSWIGVVNPAILRKGRRYAIFGVVILAAAVAPGDLLSLVIVAVPLYLLYEFSIILIVMATVSRVGTGTVLSEFGQRFRREQSPSGSSTREGNVGDE